LSFSYYGIEAIETAAVATVLETLATILINHEYSIHKVKEMESTSLSLTKEGARILPEDFRPCEDCVIVGARGRKAKQHVGNRRFLELVASELNDYAEADNKTEKSYVLAKVLYTVRRWKGDGLKIGFVKWDPVISRWIAPKDSVARVAVAQVSTSSTLQWLNMLFGDPC
jgi:hypothetical protein